MDENMDISCGDNLNSGQSESISLNPVQCSDLWHRRDPSLKKTDLDGQLHHLLKGDLTEDSLGNLLDLLKKGADPNTTDSDGNSLIHLCIMKFPKSADQIVLELIRLGANINAVNKYGSTPLTFSLYFKCQKTTLILIKRGINLHFQCQEGWTPLMIAAMLGDLFSVRKMLQHGAPVNLYDGYKRTALMFATEGSYLKVIKELLKYGANPNMRDRYNKTALHYALDRQCPKLDILNELLLHCASYDNLQPTREASFIEIMKKCMLSKQPYHNCVKLLIKIQVLLTNDLRCVEMFEGLTDFVEVCRTEVRYMGQFNVSAINSVKELLSKCVEGYMPKESELDAVSYYVANEKFPIYTDILKAIINQTYLKKKFLQLILYAKVKRVNEEKEIILNSDINLRIMPYLSDLEVSRFVMAFYIKKNSQESISSGDGCLYATGISCNWNDLVVV